MRRKIIEYLYPPLLKVPYHNIGISLSGPYILLPIRVRLGFYYTGFKKMLRGQRSSTVPSGELVEKLHDEYDEVGDLLELGSEVLSRNSDKITNILKEYIYRSERDVRQSFKVRRMFRILIRLGVVKQLKLFR